MTVKKTNPSAKSRKGLLLKLPVRERIFVAALRLIREGGTQKATMRAVCEEAGITPPTLYHYFGDMHGLYLEVVERLVDELRGNKAPRAHLPPLERIDDVWNMHVTMAHQDPGLFDLWNRHLAWDKLSETSLRSYHELENAFENLSHIQKLKIPNSKAAYIFWAAAHGMACLIAASRHNGVPYPPGAAEELKEGVLSRIFELPSN